MILLPTSSDDEIVQQDVEEWITGDDDLESDFLNDAVVQTEALEKSIAEGSEDETQEEKVSHQEGKKALQLAAVYIKQEGRIYCCRCVNKNGIKYVNCKPEVMTSTSFYCDINSPGLNHK